MIKMEETNKMKRVTKLFKSIVDMIAKWFQYIISSVYDRNDQSAFSGRYAHAYTWTVPSIFRDISRPMRDVFPPVLTHQDDKYYSGEIKSNKTTVETFVISSFLYFVMERNKKV